jgi:hypothetical protein
MGWNDLATAAVVVLAVPTLLLLLVLERHAARPSAGVLDRLTDWKRRRGGG